MDSLFGLILSDFSHCNYCGKIVGVEGEKNARDFPRGDNVYFFS